MTISVMPAQCRKALTQFEGLADRALTANLVYGGATEAVLRRAFGTRDALSGGLREETSRARDACQGNR